MDETDTDTAAPDRDNVSTDIAPIDVQRLLTWYFDVVHPGRHHITSRRQYSRIYAA
jgi:hypothetical protein